MSLHRDDLRIIRRTVIETEEKIEYDAEKLMPEYLGTAVFCTIHVTFHGDRLVPVSVDVIGEGGAFRGDMVAVPGERRFQLVPNWDSVQDDPAEETAEPFLRRVRDELLELPDNAEFEIEVASRERIME